MSAPKSTLDPEVLELLDEIAADPDSTLLRVPREPLRRFLPLREPPVSPREPMLTRAERHLVQAHREYVARLLYDACRIALTRDPIEKSRIHRWVSEGEPLDLPDEDRWRSWASRELQHGSRDDEFLPPRSLLDRCVRTGSTPAASELAGASLRLVPCDEARIWLGVALHLEGQSRSAQQAVHDVLAHRPSPLNEMWARIDCGFIAFAESDFSQAVEWYRSAASVQSEASIPTFNWLSSALQLGSEEGVSCAQERLDSIPPNDAVMEEFLRLLRPIRPTLGCKKLLSRRRKPLSLTARSVADALLC